MPNNFSYNFVGAAPAGTDLASAAAQDGVTWTNDTAMPYAGGSSVVGATSGLYTAAGSTKGDYLASWTPTDANYSVTATADFLSGGTLRKSAAEDRAMLGSNPSAVADHRTDAGGRCELPPVSPFHPFGAVMR